MSENKEPQRLGQEIERTILNKAILDMVEKYKEKGLSEYNNLSNKEKNMEAKRNKRVTRDTRNEEK